VIAVHYVLLALGHADAVGQGYAHAVEILDGLLRTAIENF
jgi:hypothetical protein